MDKDEVQSMIDQSITKAIKSHEIRVGWISGIIGALFVFGIIHSIWLIKNWMH
jgi:ethanolamine utilization microcompartment shell protein EutS